MDWRNRMGLYGSYFFGVAGIGFTLPYLPLYLGQEGLSDRTIGLVSTLAALAGLAQFPVGLWSDRIGTRKPFLIAALGVLTLATALLRGAHHVVWLAVLVVLFAENGICRAVVESLTGAEAAALARAGQVGAALGALRIWKPIGIVSMALAGSWLAERKGVGSILIPLAVVQGLGFIAAFLIHEERKSRDRLTTGDSSRGARASPACRATVRSGRLSRRWCASTRPMRPAACTWGCFSSRDLHAPERYLAYAFCVSMISLDARRLAGGLAGRPVGPPTALDRSMGHDGSAIGAGGGGANSVASDREPGARRRGQRDVRGAGGRVGDRPAGRPAALGRSPGDRWIMPGAGLGDRAGGLRFPGGVTGLSRPLWCAGGHRGDCDGHRGRSSSRRHWPSTAT